MNINVLISNIGRRGYLVGYLRNINGFNGKIFVSDCDKTASGLYTENDGYYILPKPVDNEEIYIDSLMEVCLKENIKVVIPVIDPEIYILSKYKNVFQQKEIVVLVSERKVLDICYNKLRMNTFLLQNGFNVPKTFQNIETFEYAYKNKEIEFPVIIKPVYGSGSVSTYKVESMDKLLALFDEEMIIQEFIPGVEYGIDVFNNFDKIPIRCVVKQKLAMRSGETDKALIVKNKEIQKTVISLAKNLGHIGNLDCDILNYKNRNYVIDLNPRFGGGYPATYEAGVDLLHLVLLLVCEEYITEDFECYEENIMVVKEVAIRKVKID